MSSERKRTLSLSDIETVPANKHHISVVHISDFKEPNFLNISSESFDSTSSHISATASAHMENSEEAVSNTQNALFDISPAPISNHISSTPTSPSSRPATPTVIVSENLLQDILGVVTKQSADISKLLVALTDIQNEFTLLKDRVGCNIAVPPRDQNRRTPLAVPPNSSASGQRNLEQLKRNVLPSWGSKFNYRRREYKNFNKNQREAEIYKSFLSSAQGQYIPKKYRPKFARDMVDYKLAEADSVQLMHTQCKRWERYAKTSFDKCMDVDNQVYHLIDNHPVSEEKAILLKLWDDEVRAAQAKSTAMNDKEIAFLLNLPTSDPYSGFLENVASQERGFYKKQYYNNRNQDKRPNSRPSDNRAPRFGPGAYTNPRQVTPGTSYNQSTTSQPAGPSQVRYSANTRLHVSAGSNSATAPVHGQPSSTPVQPTAGNSSGPPAWSWSGSNSATAPVHGQLSSTPVQPTAGNSSGPPAWSGYGLQPSGPLYIRRQPSNMPSSTNTFFQSPGQGPRH